MAGYPYDGTSLSGSIMTDRPWNQPWDQSPWSFQYLFEPKTGHLFCELAHR